MSVAHNLPGLPEISILRKATAAMRQNVPFEELEIGVDPYSMRHKSPGERLQATMSFVTQVYVPLAQMFQQQGIMMDLNRLTEIYAKYQDEPELMEIFSVQDPPVDSSQMGARASAGPQKPQSTSREYIRRSVGGDTAGNRQGGMQNFFSANGGQNGTQGQKNGAG